MAPPLLMNITELQSLQGKENVLHRVVCNYVEKTCMFTRLLKKGIPFVWDDLVQCTFDNLKDSIMHAPMLHPLDYSKDYFIYIAASFTTIRMVLVQEDNNDQEHVI